MLRYAAIFLILALAALVLGFLANILVGAAVVIAKICFFVFLAMFLVLIATEIFKRRKAKK